MSVRAVDDKPSDTLVVVSDEGSWTGSSTLPHLHHTFRPPTHGAYDEQQSRWPIGQLFSPCDNGQLFSPHVLKIVVRGET